ncbi:hypothetical protein A3J90_00880 [candidate division WOR-1 bacterium RIFOXYC2_FULL_37_10]|uniref:Uncharacterized protein n=1 Tax=candidate division WOR-1 bacterium RIFOXYB2_FULL_37_13 TaxID=1802579 RepID=A0A1F4SY01_UNCSA|nr:MAG: hypothetical protein A2310_08920 [candidate division WOR-1 bacterium RIFOXYB2_FULL_37_13]OGC35492.1 MAG: hypothetical protein A3J90_00880 [candidate division WOR-1 bacterium RIFOXYC2_FULL_37_10]
MMGQLCFSRDPNIPVYVSRQTQVAGQIGIEDLHKCKHPKGFDTALIVPVSVISPIVSPYLSAADIMAGSDKNLYFELAFFQLCSHVVLASFLGFQSQSGQIYPIEGIPFFKDLDPAAMEEASAFLGDEITSAKRDNIIRDNIIAVPVCENILNKQGNWERTNLGGFALTLKIVRQLGWIRSNHKDFSYPTREFLAHLYYSQFIDAILRAETFRFSRFNIPNLILTFSALRAKQETKELYLALSPEEKTLFLK